jgi:hypothetical protein
VLKARSTIAARIVDDPGIAGDPDARQTNSDLSILRDRLQAKALERTLRIANMGNGENGRD